MNDAPCPSCEEPTGEVVDRTVLEEGGLAISFRCADCDRTWQVVF